MLSSGEWLEHPYRRPKTYCEILDQRQQRQQRVLGGGHPRLDGGSREPSVHTLIPQRRRGAGAPAVGASMGVGADGLVSLVLSVRAAPSKAAPKGLANLRDFLGAGRSDPFANESVQSVACEMIETCRGGERPRAWGCLCRGNVLHGGVELICRRCSLAFHTK